MEWNVMETYWARLLGAAAAAEPPPVTPVAKPVGVPLTWALAYRAKAPIEARSRAEIFMMIREFQKR